MTLEIALWGLISKIYKELKKLDIKIPNIQIKKWDTDLNREFSTEESQMAERHLRKCSTFLAIMEMQIKITLRYHLIPVRMAKIKNTDESLSWRGCGSIAGGSVNLNSFCGNEYGDFSDN